MSSAWKTAGTFCRQAHFLVCLCFIPPGLSLRSPLLGDLKLLGKMLFTSAASQAYRTVADCVAG